MRGDVCVGTGGAWCQMLRSYVERPGVLGYLQNSAVLIATNTVHKIAGGIFGAPNPAASAKVGRGGWQRHYQSRSWDFASWQIIRVWGLGLGPADWQSLGSKKGLGFIGLGTMITCILCSQCLIEWCPVMSATA